MQQSRLAKGIASRAPSRARTLHRRGGTLATPRCPTERGRAPHHPCDRRHPVLDGALPERGAPMQRKTEPEIVSTDTALGRCLVDGDAATNSRDRRRRQKALGISLAIEAVALTLLIVAPLMTSVAQPRYSGTEIVRFFFGGSPTHTPAGHPPPGIHHPPTLGDQRIKFTTDQTPPRPARTMEERDDASNADLDASNIFSDHTGPLISGLQPTGAEIGRAHV